MCAQVTLSDIIPGHNQPCSKFWQHLPLVTDIHSSPADLEKLGSDYVNRCSALLEMDAGMMDMIISLILKMNCLIDTDHQVGGIFHR